MPKQGSKVSTNRLVEKTHLHYKKPAMDDYTSCKGIARYGVDKDWKDETTKDLDLDKRNTVRSLSPGVELWM
jgi:hypothetical protein